jgi:hypothetical protein
VLITAVEGGRAALDRYVRTAYGMPLDVVEKIQLLIAGPLEVIAERLAGYAAAGARQVICRLAAPDLDAARRQLTALSHAL